MHNARCGWLTGVKEMDLSIDLQRYIRWALPLLLLSVVSFTGCRLFAGPQLTPTPVPLAQGGDPTLVIYPDHGPGGSYVQVTGADWPGEAFVIVMVADAQGRSEILARETTSTAGQLATGFLYPFDKRWLTPGQYTVIAEAVESGLHAQSPFTVGEKVAAVATTVVPFTPTAAPTVTVPLTPTGSPSATTLPTALPPTPVPPPTATPTSVPPTAVPNQPPQIVAALVPVDEIDAKGGRFRIMVEATDPEGDLQGMIIVLKLPASAQAREARLRENRKTEITFTPNRIEIRAPNPQALLDQINAYGGILVENGQEIELKVRDRDESRLTWREDRWRIEAPILEVAIGASDGAGLSTVQQVVACLEAGCPGVAADD